MFSIDCMNNSLKYYVLLLTKSDVILVF